jgi:hypothetical protein
MRSGSVVRRGGRGCSRASCRKPAQRTLTYIYSDSTALVGPLATFAEPHAYDLCLEHCEKLTVPNGWTVITADLTQDESGQFGQSGQAGPNSDDIMAIADAVREIGAQRHHEPRVEQATPQNEVGRRGHLRALPSQ